VIWDWLAPVRSSYVEILGLKKDIRNWFLNQWCSKQTGKIKIESYHLIEQAFKDFTSMRRHLSPYPNGEKVNSQWKLDLSPALCDLVDLMEDLIADVVFDGRYKDAIRGGSEATDFMDYDSVQKRLKPIEDALAEATTAASAEDSAAASAGGADGSAASAGGDDTAASAGAGSTAASADGSGLADSATPKSGFGSMSEHSQARWLKHINKLIDTYIDLVPDEGSVTDLQNAIKDSKLASIMGDPTGLVLFHFDAKLCGAENDPC